MASEMADKLYAETLINPTSNGQNSATKARSQGIVGHAA